MKYELISLCEYRKGKVNVETLSNDNYISTENMLPNKGGITRSAALPTTSQTQEFKKNDVLVSNIRPYFKKIWQAKFDGGCSNDVLVFKANENTDADFLYYVLADDGFFRYSMATSKGTKMPRGDKTSIMHYKVPNYKITEQRKIANVLRSIDDKIELNNKINNNLEQQTQALFNAWFMDFVPFNGIQPDKWRASSLGEVSNMGAGGDKPKIISSIQSMECPYPVYSNGLSENGLYGYTNIPKICEESVTVSARGTIGFVCIRHIPFVPIVRLVTLIPKTEIVSAKYLYLYLKQLNITGTGTTQQQLTVPDFRKTEILVPDKETMVTFTDIITPLFSKLWSNEEENTRLANLRDTLLPKLMSGELDVSEIDL